MPSVVPQRLWFRRSLLILVIFGGIVALGVSLAPAGMRARADNPIWRGQRLAARSGCFDCHRAPLRQDLTNPGARLAVVPGFDSGDLPMYAQSAAEVEEWIRDGSTARLRGDAEAWKNYEAQLIRMPPFGARLRSDQVSDLAAFVIAANAFHSPSDVAAQRGEEIARAQCLSCHNVGGAGGLPNPGSVFAYIPGLWGPDFEDLARQPAELRDWILRGSTQRVDDWPLVGHFRTRQTLQMPAFGDVLSAEDVDALIAYISWLGATGGGVQP